MKKLLTTTFALVLLVPAAGFSDGEEVHKNCPENASDCAKGMKEQFAKRGWVGINMDYDKERGVTVISNVVAKSPAEAAGFEIGDVLQGLNGIDYTEENEEALKKEYGSFQPGSLVTFEIERDGKAMDIEVELEQIPQAILAQWIGQHVLEYHQGEEEIAVVEDEESDESP